MCIIYQAVYLVFVYFTVWKLYLKFKKKGKRKETRHVLTLAPPIPHILNCFFHITSLKNLLLYIWPLPSRSVSLFCLLKVSITVIVMSPKRYQSFPLMGDDDPSQAEHASQLCSPVATNNIRHITPKIFLWGSAEFGQQPPLAQCLIHKEMSF